MEKGFNDQELADIMNEIESLEREFGDDAGAQAESKEVMAELAATEPAKAVQKTNHAADANVVALKPSPAAPASASSSAPASLTFNVSGEMCMNLVFELNGQKVSMAVTGEGLSIETESGARFSLPVGAAAARRKSA